MKQDVRESVVSWLETHSRPVSMLMDKYSETDGVDRLDQRPVASSASPTKSHTAPAQEP